MAKRKNRKEKQLQYEEKYQEIPLDYLERLAWMCDKYKLSEKKMDEIIQTRDEMMQSLIYKNIKIVLYEEPEGTPRSRFRIINRNNLINAAMTNGQFVHVYSLNAKEDSVFMKRILDEGELMEIEYLLHTPCIINYNSYLKTPGYYDTTHTFLAEIGIDRPLTKPDWDNIGKKYCDMSNGNIWLDDILVISGTVDKFYSILPRIEINISFLNMVYNKYQYKSITGRKDYDESFNLKYFNMEEK